jgi:hypothetical protein
MRNDCECGCADESAAHPYGDPLLAYSGKVPVGTYPWLWRRTSPVVSVGNLLRGLRESMPAEQLAFDITRHLVLSVKLS